MRYANFNSNHSTVPRLPSSFFFPWRSLLDWLASDRDEVDAVAVAAPVGQVVAEVGACEVKDKKKRHETRRPTEKALLGNARALL